MYKLRKTSCIVSSLLLFIAMNSVQQETHAAIIVQFDTTFGDFNVELYDTDTPISVANFLAYVNAGLYSDTLIHRSDSNFVIQGGGYYFSGSVPTFGPIADEIGISNLRGTLAYANTGSPNTNVNQWFINTSDNLFLDTGFTVFGRVLDDGMDIVDQINLLPTVNIGAPFNELPVINPSLPLTASNLVFVNTITVIPEPGAIFLLGASLTYVGARHRWRRMSARTGGF